MLGQVLIGNAAVIKRHFVPWPYFTLSRCNDSQGEARTLPFCVCLYSKGPSLVTHNIPMISRRAIKLHSPRMKTFIFYILSRPSARQPSPWHDFEKLDFFFPDGCPLKHDINMSISVELCLLYFQKEKKPQTKQTNKQKAPINQTNKQIHPPKMQSKTPQKKTVGKKVTVKYHTTTWER